MFSPLGGWMLSISVRRLAITFILLAATCWSQAEPPKPALASDAVPADRMQQYADLAVQWEQEYLRIDTTNPPGNETRAAAFYKQILDQEGIETRVFEYAPGRADLWARLP